MKSSTHIGEKTISLKTHLDYIVLIIISVSQILLSSCNRTITNRTVEGRVWDTVTGMPINKAKVVLKQPSPSYLGLEETTYTDETGYYKVRFNAYRGSTIYVRAGIGYENGLNDIYDLGEESSPYDDLGLIEPLKIDIKTGPISYLSIEVHNENPYDEKDLIRIINFFSGYEGTGASNLGLFPIKSNGERIGWWTLRNGDFSENYYDSVFVTPYDTLYYHIYY